jgi:hypothetical protein
VGVRVPTPVHEKPSTFQKWRVGGYLIKEG